jgi:hypothetical protein
MPLGAQSGVMRVNKKGHDGAHRVARNASAYAALANRLTDNGGTEQ